MSDQPIAFPVPRHGMTVAHVDLARPGKDMSAAFPPPIPDPIALAEAPRESKPCAKCGAGCDVPVGSDNAVLCATCFAVIANRVGTPAGDVDPRSVRIVYNWKCDAQDVRDHRHEMAECVEEAIGYAAKDIAGQLAAALLAGDAKAHHLLYEASKHGLLVVVVLQPAIAAPLIVKPGA
jgi:hypothetical protein